MSRRAWIGLGLLAGTLAVPVSATTVTQFVPEGEAAVVRQVRATFSEPMVALGQPDASAPFSIECPEAGSGRWSDPQTWIYEFRRDLPPGTACRFALKPALRAAAGTVVSGTQAFAFRTGGPAVVRAEPYPGGPEIDEEQVFVLTLNGAATEASVRASTWCEAENLGERIPVAVVAGADRNELVKRFRLEPDADRVVMLRCQQRLQNGAKVALVWGRGVATPSGMATTREQRFGYTVRRPFEATFTCERENAHAPCVPVRPLAVEFSAPVPRELADGIRLATTAGTAAPYWRRNARDPLVQRVEFAAPLPESSEATISLPKGLRDDTGRPLANIGAFPLRVRIGAAPPLVKFPGTFGIVEAGADAALPVTVRNLEGDAKGSIAAGLPIAMIRPESDPEVIAWLKRLHGRGFDFERPEGCSPDGAGGRPAAATGSPTPPADCRQAREVSLLSGESRLERRSLPATGSAKSFEVIGIPLPKPGYYVVEVESPALGAALLARSGPMFVRTSVLVTNLAVHFKRGRDNALAWVTRLDTGKPVVDAEVRVSDCQGKELWRGRADRTGLARIPDRLEPRGSCQPRSNQGRNEPALFVSARAGEDFAFVLSNWNAGIERWRFGVPTSDVGGTGLRAHTAFDRTLLRAGETVSMKHFIRRDSVDGLAHVAASSAPDRLRIRHVGSGQEYEQPISWLNGAAASSFAIPREARLGVYEVVLVRTREPAGAHAGPGPPADLQKEAEQLWTGTFRVAEFRLPVMEGRIAPPGGAQVAVREVPYSVQLNYVGGGPAAGHEIRVSSVLRPHFVAFAGYERFRFDVDEGAESGEQQEREKLVADRVPVRLDGNGAGKVVIRDLPQAPAARALRTEATFLDPNGEQGTVAADTPLWPSSVVVGIRTDGWVAVGKSAGVTMVTLDTSGKPVPGTAVVVRAESRITVSHRRRLVGGFYAYKHRTERKSLGRVCSGRSDAQGLVRCEIAVDTPGNVVLTAEARDGKGNASRADASVWVTEQGEVWFEAENHDRMDVVPEKKRYEPGETARFQLRLPFRHATVLVSVEREGVIETFVREANGRNPSIDVPVRDGYGPNVFVTALAVRGRLREVPWYSALTWGWRSPIEWWQARREWKEKGRPGPMVDLAKPAFKYGVAEIQVGIGSRELAVRVSPSRETYRIREKASVKVQVRMPDGTRPPPGSRVAIAAVDQALLELQPNLSWNLLDAMYGRRGYAVETATAQMQVIGRRHYGRKAVAQGGGGGRGPTRELFDTLLLWTPNVELDGNGEATVEVPLNDSLSRFALIAIADVGAGHFGTGRGSLSVTQDLQIASGLPPIVRGGDAYRPTVMIRNTTSRSMRVIVDARSGSAPMSSQTIEVPAGEAREVGWRVTVPDEADASSVEWEVAAREDGGPARDTLRVVQKRLPLVPIAVQQASLVRLQPGANSTRVAPPADALANRGGIQVSLSPKLGQSSAAVRRFFEDYPLVCLEQKVSRAIGLRDPELWRKTIDELPAYLDADGLARYFPGEQPGSDILTSYLLATSHESGMALPGALAERMLAGLAAFVDGRIQRTFWSPRGDLDVRKLAAVEALSRYGRAVPRQLESLSIEPNGWPTGAVIDWYSILGRVPAIPNLAAHRARADQVLRSRLDFSGTRLGFSTEADDQWWWLMASADANAARLVLAVIGSPAWRVDMPRLIAGLTGRQVRGRWSTTTANVWGSLALEKFSAAFEKEAVSGRTVVRLEGANGPSGLPEGIDWAAKPAGGRVSLGWGSATASSPGTLRLDHAGAGRPWATIQSLAAVPTLSDRFAGYQIVRTVIPVEQRDRGRFSRGDIVRVRLEIDARSDMTWVVVSDSVPSGASILGTGLGRDSEIARRGERRTGLAWPAFEERGFDVYRAYYEFVPKGKWTLEYTLRLNGEGSFNLAATRVEAMYAPEMFGETANAQLVVSP